MKVFTYAKVTESPAQAVAEVASQPESFYIAGGTNLIDLMKESVLTPSHLVDISGLNLSSVEQLPGGGLLIGALASNADVANNKLVRNQYPILSRALLSGASPQLRNMATMGGNVMQRTRCYYFYDVDSACNKRDPGSGCAAIEGVNRIHSILGASKHCIAAHPSDMCVALACLDAVLHLHGPAGDRLVPINSFYALPGTTPHIETVLKDHEMITHVELPAAGFSSNWCYLKVRERASYAFALVSVAAALELQADKIKSARLALGAVAPKPWRAQEAEKLMKGKTADEKTFKTVAEAIMQAAKPFDHNKYKVELGKRAIVRALKIAAKGGVA